MNIMAKKWFWLGSLLLAFGVYLLWSIDYVGPQGVIQKEILSNKDAVADILPPPLYMVESFLLMNHYFQASTPEERAGFLKLIDGKHQAFLDRKQFWITNSFYNSHANKLLFDQVFATGEKTFKLFGEFSEKNSTKAAGSRNAHSLLKQEIATNFELHRDAVEQLVSHLRMQQTGLIAHSAAQLKQNRFIIVILILFFTLLSFMIGTAKVERSFFSIEQIWLPLLVAVLSYWVYGQMGQRLHGFTSHSSSRLWGFLDLVFVGFVTVVTARIMRSRYLGMTGKVLASEQLYRELLQNYSVDIVARLEEDRKRISREVHDGIIQLLGSVKFRLESIKGFWKREAVIQEGDLDRSLELLQTSITDLRRLCHELRPSLLDQVGLITAMHSLIEDFESQTNVVVIADFEFQDEVLSEPQRLALFRIFQEILNNCEKHSGATEINMSIQTDDLHLSMEVSDNGKGKEILKNGLPAKTGMGLINIQERVRALSGQVEISSSAGLGFQVNIKIPLTQGRVENEHGASSINVGG